ncbi:MAG TPA: NADH-dependent alcohol dehydrogenase, partial [Chryseobacterium indologenes]|nr:NADH-dependent alcohol dehydrogenase [Chryseobacterium indologenes]
YNGTAERVEKAFTDRNWLGLGEYRKLTPQDAYKIVEMSY